MAILKCFARADGWPSREFDTSKFVKDISYEADEDGITIYNKKKPVFIWHGTYSVEASDLKEQLYGKV
jgi:hypothetical protein